MSKSCIKQVSLYLSKGRWADFFDCVARSVHNELKLKAMLYNKLLLG